MAQGAIETIYKGYRFRSRLEARWAVFFDSLGIAWRYETQGYEVDGHRYLPDFQLPDSGLWVEVKGDPEGLRTDHLRMRKVLGPTSPLEGFAAGDSALLVLGDVPAAPDGCLLHPVLRRIGDRLTRTWGCFLKQKSGPACYVFEPHALFSLFLVPTVSDLESSAQSNGWDTGAQRLPTPGQWPEVRDAYRAARQARFEHGERP